MFDVFLVVTRMFWLVVYMAARVFGCLLGGYLDVIIGC